MYHLIEKLAKNLRVTPIQLFIRNRCDTLE